MNFLTGKKLSFNELLFPRTVTAGTPVGVVGGVTHAVFAGHDGVVYHEDAGSDRAGRKTWFAP